MQYRRMPGAAGRAGRWALGIAALALILFLGASAARAQGAPPPGRITVDPHDSPLRIADVPSEGGTLAGNLRLTALGGPVDRFIFLPYDLQAQDNPAAPPIARQHITLLGDPTLPAETPKDFQVQVTGLQRPGTYAGTVAFLLPAQPVSAALILTLQVEVRARPVLTPLPGTDQVALRLVHCEPWLLVDCWLAGRVLPASAFLTNRPLQFDNTTGAPVTVTNVALVAQGDKTGYVLPAGALRVSTETMPLAANSIVALPLAVDRYALPSDHYAGSLYLTLAGSPTRLKLPLDMSVRSGPLGPLLALFLGILLGQLSKYMQGRGGQVAAAVASLYQLKIRLQAHPDDAETVQWMVDDAERAINWGQLDVATAALPAIATRLDMLIDLRRLEGQLQRQPAGQAAVQAALADIEHARQLLGQPGDAALTAAGTLRDSVQQTLNSLQVPPPQAAARDIEATAAPEPGTTGGPPRRRLGLGDRFVALVNDFQSALAPLTWLARPLLKLALLLGLVVIGLRTFYVDSGATFGADPLGDYLGLILWGLSADVASRSLSNLGTLGGLQPPAPVDSTRGTAGAPGGGGAPPPGGGPIARGLAGAVARIAPGSRRAGPPPASAAGPPRPGGSGPPIDNSQPGGAGGGNAPPGGTTVIRPAGDQAGPATTPGGSAIMTGTTPAPNKWALLIGINKYPHLPADKQLNGCVNDAEVMANILQTKFGFPAAGITRLLDEQATYDGILGAMDALVARVAANDVVVLLYSGHGSQMTDREGDELDGMDETIVPHDGGRPGPKPDITDDQIYVRLLQLTDKTPFVTLLFDSCHSATITRDVFGAQARWVDPDIRPVTELPPSPPEVAALRAAQGPASRDIGPSGWLPLGDRYVLIAGCRDEEKSYEHPILPNPATPSHGALTFYLSQELDQAGPGTTYRDVFERASLGVTGYASAQHPQMEGRIDRELFGVRDIDPLNFVAVQARDGAGVRLGAGAAQGLTVGSRWAIYPQGTKTVAADTPRLGTVEITAAGAVAADAAIRDESPAGAIVVNSRAVEEAHNYGEMRWIVDIQVPAGSEAAREALAAQIAASSLLRPAGAGAAPDARVYLIPPRAVAGPADPVPQLGAVTAAIWAVVGVDGRLAMPPQPVDSPAAIGTIRENLERLVRYQLALTLRNPSPTSPLKDKVTVRLLRRAADGTWAPVPRDAGNQLVLNTGDQVGLEVVNGYTDPIYVNVLDFGLARGVSAIYPIRGAAEAVNPGGTLPIGMREGSKITMSFPANYPFAQTGDPADRAARGGIETFKVFVTTAPADFRPLLQTGVRGDTLVTARDLGGDSPLNRLLTLAMTGRGTRETEVTQLGPADDWTTVEVSFLLQPPDPSKL